MLGQIRGHGQLPAVNRGVAEAAQAVLGRDLQRDEIPAAWIRTQPSLSWTIRILGTSNWMIASASRYAEAAMMNTVR